MDLVTGAAEELMSSHGGLPGSEGMWDMSWNTMKGRADLSSIAIPTSHDVLSEILISVRSTCPRADRSHLSDAGLARLIDFSFYGSLETEEGRYPACRLFCYPEVDKDDQLRTVAVFERPIELELGALRRLVHLAPSDRHALVVVEDGPRLAITRIMAIDSTREIGHLGRPEYWTAYQTPIGTMVTVEGPGSLRATEAGVTLNLRAGRIEEAITFAFVPGVADWCDAVSNELIGRAEEVHPKSKTYFGGNMSMLIRSVWSQVLSDCVSQRHGGAFVVMSPDDMDGNMGLKYPLEPVNLGGKVVDFWLSCVETDYKEKRDLNLWLRRQNSFRKQIDVVSSLANVDGCVCVTRDLKVLGCGGEILVSEKVAMDSHLVLVDAKTKNPREQQGSAQFGGTRHRSAYRLCKVVPNALAFVVSQDGNLGVFYSDDKYVYAFRALGPWFTNADLE